MNDIEKLIQDYSEAKIQEVMATEARVNIGRLLAERLGVPVEGGRTYDVCGHKVTIKQPVNRTVDWNEFGRLSADMEHPPMVMKPSLDVKGLKWMEEHDPDNYRKLSRAITAKPGRVAVSIKAGES